MKKIYTQLISLTVKNLNYLLIWMVIYPVSIFLIKTNFLSFCYILEVDEEILFRVNNAKDGNWVKLPASKSN